MLHWLGNLAGFVLAAVITAAILGFIHRRGVARRHAALLEGRPTSFAAFLRANAAPYPRRWREGTISLGLGPPVWRPRVGLRRESIQLPVSATVESTHHATGIKEMVATNPDCVIVVARAGDAVLELAIRDFDLPTALSSLEMGSGGGWRLDAGMRK